ncbi:hypothetical protein BGX34_000887, partial [Mortierella sp. NVP85]
MHEHPPIVYDLTSYKEETKDWDKDSSAYLLRYYTKHYFLATTGKNQKPTQQPTTTTATTTAAASGSEVTHGFSNTIDSASGLQILRGDQFVYQSPNKLCVTGLAPTHPLLCQRDRYEVLNIQFEPKILSCLPQPTAIPANAKKQPPPFCHPDTVICKIEARDLSCNEKSDKEMQDGKDKSQERSTMEPIITGDLEKDGEGSRMEQDIPLANVDSGSNIVSEATATLSSSSSSSSSSSPSSTSPPSIAASISGRAFKQRLHVTKDPSRVLFVIRAAISGHVIELNERLVRRGSSEITDPGVIQTLLDK